MLSSSLSHCLSSQRELGTGRSKGLVGERGWEGAKAELSYTPGAFDGFTIVCLLGQEGTHLIMCQVNSSVSAGTCPGWHVNNQSFYGG